MFKDIVNFIKACHICQITKKIHRPSFGHMGSLPLATQPFDIVALDTIGGLGKYGSPKNFIHVMIDHHSRYIWATPSRSTSIATYINCIQKILTINTPKYILTDRAPAFTSQRFKKFLAQHGIKHLSTSTYNPQTNGKLERANYTLVQKLKHKHQENNKLPWTKHLPKVVEEINLTPHSVTLFPPQYLMFGTLPINMSQYSDPYPPLEEARSLAIKRTELHHQKQVEAHNSKHPPAKFKVGDKVLLRNYYHPDMGKLAPAFIGPFTIMKVLSPQTVEIDKRNIPLGRQTEIVNVNKLRYYVIPEVNPVEDSHDREVGDSWEQESLPFKEDELETSHQETSPLRNTANDHSHNTINCFSLNPLANPYYPRSESNLHSCSSDSWQGSLGNTSCSPTNFNNFFKGYINYVPYVGLLYYLPCIIPLSFLFPSFQVYPSF